MLQYYIYCCPDAASMFLIDLLELQPDYVMMYYLGDVPPQFYVCRCNQEATNMKLEWKVVYLKSSFEIF